MNHNKQEVKHKVKIKKKLYEEQPTVQKGKLCSTENNNQIIHLIRQTCLRIMSKEIIQLNDVLTDKKPRPFINIETLPGINQSWLFDTGASVTCMSLKAFREIKGQRPTQVNSVGSSAKGASGQKLIPDGTYIIPMEFRGKKIMQRVQVFRNLNTPALLGIDAIDNLGITYLSRKRNFTSKMTF